MFSSRFIEELRAQCPFLNELPETWQHALGAAIQKTCDKFGIVTQEEFDIQVDTLEKIRAKLAKIERQLLP